ncbi:MAG: hypothetical protein DRK00_03030 [Thermoprotei archaeon]|mgnify:CR=1 FL=1|nr:MAG: hypothetical protein DRK00_03030 [Thermoprotei archaeon]
MKDVLLEACKLAVEEAEKRGASEAEALGLYTRVLTAKRGLRGIEEFSSSESAWLGVRVAVGRRVAIYAATGLDRRSVESAVEAALRIAKASSEDRDWRGFPRRLGFTRVEGVYDRATAEATAEEVIERLEVLSSSIRGAKLVEAGLAARVSHAAIVNSYASGLYRSSTSAFCWAEAIYEEAGQQSTGAEHDSARRLSDLKIEEVGRIASERAKRFLRAKPIETGMLDVIFINKQAAAIVQLMISSAVSALEVQEGRSPLRDKVGEEVASENFTVIDDGTLPRGVGSREFDDEGVPTRRSVVIERGILKTFLYDSYTAFREGRESTGNAHRAPWSRPRPAPNNLVVEPGRGGLEELVEEVRKGLVVYDTIGAWLSNPVSGAFTATVSQGMLVVNGEEREPVKGVIVVGNFWEMVKQKLATVGGDLAHVGASYSPSLYFRDLTIAGR